MCCLRDYQQTCPTTLRVSPCIRVISCDLKSAPRLLHEMPTGGGLVSCEAYFSRYKVSRVAFVMGILWNVRSRGGAFRAKPLVDPCRGAWRANGPEPVTTPCLQPPHLLLYVPRCPASLPSFPHLSLPPLTLFAHLSVSAIRPYFHHVTSRRRRQFQREPPLQPPTTRW